MTTGYQPAQERAPDLASYLERQLDHLDSMSCYSDLALNHLDDLLSQWLTAEHTRSAHSALYMGVLLGLLSHQHTRHSKTK